MKMNPCLTVNRGRHRCNATILLCLFSMLLAVMLQRNCATEAFILSNPSGHINNWHHPLTLKSSLSETENVQVANVNNDNDDIDDDMSYHGDISVESYEHKTFKKLTYLYKKASPGREGDRPIILIHPVGIGLSSWFWKKVMMQSFTTNSEDEFGNDYSYNNSRIKSGNPPIYAPDLIGCGIDHGGDAWNPNENGLFFPLGWVEGVETLMNDVIIPRWYDEQNNGKSASLSRFFGVGQSNQNNGTSNSNGDGAGCLVIAQGGLAPVGIMLAHRNPLHVQNLMLTSPPTYDEITTPIPESELRTNYDFLRSPILGNLAFAALENRAIIEFFSNLFLFDDDCDEEWLDETERESRYVEARTPVQVFNAGLLQHRSLEGELKELVQSVWVVSGEGDKRVLDRQMYRDELDKCTLTSIGGCNVLPWENAAGVVELIKKLGY
mmetsp:Transcript_11668/g.25192  ORF Transcript_11668/g.25192 Transcript_11668/m.25192 type:complete len:437 (-) Transcript_11668:28-1338(-)